MTTRGLEDLDGGLGSCLPSDDLPFLEEPASGRRPESKARGTSRRADSSDWTHVSSFSLSLSLSFTLSFFFLLFLLLELGSHIAQAVLKFKPQG
uniref:Junctional sarcoplasmic reticulum protein 1 n=1 Tax=Mus musculus TaxID=10090 RepID=M0QWR3_MOUSE